MKIQAVYIANLFEYASYKGISEEMLRNHLKVNNIDVCDPNNTVTSTEYQNVFKELMIVTDDMHFGIHYGCFLNIKALGFIVQISLNATNIKQAVFILQNYLQSTFPLVGIEAEVQKDKYILSLTSEIEDVKLKTQILDFVFCFVYRELKLMLPKDLSIEFKVPNSNNTEFKKSLNDEILKGKKYNFILPKTVLNAEINIKKAKEIEILLPKFLQMLDKKKSGYKAFSVQIRNMILNLCDPEPPTFEQVSRHFPMSNRTIQRKLMEEETSFRKIVDDIKNELSSYLSKGHKMKTQDIAYLLGYSEASAYLHAVKKWEAVFFAKP